MLLNIQLFKLNFGINNLPSLVSVLGEPRKQMVRLV
jgi:hypothetical protein